MNVCIIGMIFTPRPISFDLWLVESMGVDPMYRGLIVFPFWFVYFELGFFSIPYHVVLYLCDKNIPKFKPAKWNLNQ